LCCVLTSALSFACTMQVPSPLYCINNQHNFKWWGQNQRFLCYVINLIFDLDPDPPVEKWFPRAWTIVNIFYHFHFIFSKEAHQ